MSLIQRTNCEWRWIVVRTNFNVHVAKWWWGKSSLWIWEKKRVFKDSNMDKKWELWNIEVWGAKDHRDFVNMTLDELHVFRDVLWSFDDMLDLFDVTLSWFCICVHENSFCLLRCFSIVFCYMKFLNEKFLHSYEIIKYLKINSSILNCLKIRRCMQHKSFKRLIFLIPILENLRDLKQLKLL